MTNAALVEKRGQRISLSFSLAGGYRTIPATHLRRHFVTALGKRKSYGRKLRFPIAIFEEMVYNISINS